MRWVLLLLTMGCNAMFGLDSTSAIPDADPNSACGPLLYDANRYAIIAPAVTWTAAQDACGLRYGMDLAVFDQGDSEEIAHQDNHAPAPYWLGVSRGTSGWETVDKCEPLLVPFNVSGALGQCVAMSTNTTMVATDCTSSTLGADGISALCETPRPSPACVTTAAGRDYMVLSGDMTGYGVATACQMVGMTVLEINSTAELEYVVANVAPSLPVFWVAAHHTSTTFTSISGCPQVFVWKASEPSLASGADCVRYNAGGMEQVDCGTVTANIVCERNQ